MRVGERAGPHFVRGTAGALACAAVALAALLNSPLARAEAPASLVLDYQFDRAPPKQPKVVFAPAPLARPPELTGELSDPCWARCAALHLGSDMPEGVPARRTQAHVCWSGDTLYVSFECYEPAIADLPLVREPTRGVWSEENVQVWLAPPGGERDFFLFAADPNGSRYEKRGLDADRGNVQPGAEWAPDWTVKTSRATDGWNAEMAIPLKSFGATRPKKGDSWRINLCRDVATTGERCSWEGTMGNRANPAAWGVLFFGDPDAFAKRPVPPRLTLYAGQKTLGARERFLRVVVRIEPGSVSLASAKLRASLEPAEGMVATDLLPTPSMIPVQGERAGLLLNIADLPVGDFILRAELLDAEGRTSARSEAALKKPADAAEPQARAGKVHILVRPVPLKAKAASAWPVSAGVALPIGAMTSADNVRLLGPDGKEVPCRARARSRWPGDSSIRWLGVDFRANISRVGGERYTLEYGPGVRPAVLRGFTKKIQALKMEVGEDAWIVDTGDAWWINTGVLLFNINYKKFSGIMGTWLDVHGDGRYDWTGQVLNGESASAGPYVVDSAGRVYRLAADPDTRVELEEYDEMRLVFRVEGRLSPVNGAPALDMGRCVLRITAFFGRPFLRLQCSYLFNARAAHGLLSDVGIMEKLFFRSHYDAIFGTSETFSRSIQDTGAIYLLELLPRLFLLQNVKAPPTINLRPAGAQNWAAAAASDRGLVVAVRDMNHLYPKEIEMTPENRILIHFWPPHGTDSERTQKTEVNRRTVGALAFATDGRLLDLRVPAAYASALKDRDGLRDFDAVRNMDISDSTGIALTYDVLYTFFKGAFDPAETSEIARAFEICPEPVQDPESLAASGVLQEMLPPARLERASGMLARLLALEDRMPAAGDFNFMDVRRTWLPDEQRFSLRNYWMGANADLPGALWLLYLQTGRPDVFLAARRNLRHLLSMDICHDATEALTESADPRRRKIVGAFGDCRTPVHWQSVCSVSDRHARVRALFLAYYLTGDLNARDTALLWAEAAKNYGPVTAGEDGLAYLTNLSEVLALEYDPALLEQYGECSDYLFRMPLDLTQTEHWIPGLRGYFATTGDPRADAYLQRFANRLKADAAVGNLRPLGLWRDLYAVTGEAAYQNQAQKRIEDIEKSVDTRVNPQDAPPFSWDDFCSYIFNAGEPAASFKRPAAK